MATNQCFVVVSDAGESWALEGDEEFGESSKGDDNELLPKMLSDGWTVSSVTAGSGSKDETSYWLVLLVKAA